MSKAVEAGLSPARGVPPQNTVFRAARQRAGADYPVPLTPLRRRESAASARPSRAKITPWRVLNTVVVLITGVVWTLICYWVGVYEQENPALSARWFFAYDLARVLGIVLIGFLGALLGTIALTVMLLGPQQEKSLNDGVQKLSVAHGSSPDFPAEFCRQLEESFDADSRALCDHKSFDAEVQKPTDSPDRSLHPTACGVGSNGVHKLRVMPDSSPDFEFCGQLEESFDADFPTLLCDHKSFDAEVQKLTDSHDGLDSLIVTACGVGSESTQWPANCSVHGSSPDSRVLSCDQLIKIESFDAEVQEWSAPHGSSPIIPTFTSNSSFTEWPSTTGLGLDAFVKGADFNWMPLTITVGLMLPFWVMVASE
ncbi:hypothetical protein FB451DRAFT_1529619 [Mycena latifolia]|nr:hypothetical protein FB451DRAFT_1529619 [Mycena latifolia]